MKTIFNKPTEARAVGYRAAPLRPWMSIATRPLYRAAPFGVNRRHRGGYGNLGDVDEPPDFRSASAGHAAPRVGPLSPDQQPATKADLYAAVDALRADIRGLMDEVRTLIAEADRRVSEAERTRGLGRDAQW